MSDEKLREEIAVALVAEIERQTDGSWPVDTGATSEAMLYETYGDVVLRKPSR